MHGFLASVRYSLRLLLKSPGFTITAVLILGFGIGASTAIFSLIDCVVLKPLLIGAAAALLLISTINVATLLIARTSDRQREMTIRTAMGASRFRLIVQSLVESALLSLMGGFPKSWNYYQPGASRNLLP